MEQARDAVDLARRRRRPGAAWRDRRDDRAASGAVATSGTAERGGHIIEPASGRPAGGARSATVVGADLATADVWATAAVVAGAEDLSWIGGAPVASGLVVSSDGGVRRFANGVELCIGPAA